MFRRLAVITCATLAVVATPVAAHAAPGQTADSTATRVKMLESKDVKMLDARDVKML